MFEHDLGILQALRHAIIAATGITIKDTNGLPADTVTVICAYHHLLARTEPSFAVSHRPHSIASEHQEAVL